MTSAIAFCLYEPSFREAQLYTINLKQLISPIDKTTQLDARFQMHQAGLIII